ncbi:hypothetical protein MRX96_034471 [Rhipicephalus microplus]
MNEIPPPKEYRLNLRVVLMSILIGIAGCASPVSKLTRQCSWRKTSAVYPPSPSVKSVTHSDPWLCTSAKTTLRGSFSSPGLRSQVDDTRTAACLLSGFLPLKPTAAVHSQSTTTVDSPSQCEQVARVSCHQPCGCYESYVQRTTYEKFHKVSDNIDIIKCIERSEVVTMESAMAPSPEPPSMTIRMEEPMKPVMSRKEEAGGFFGTYLVGATTRSS